MKGLFIPDITVEMFRNGCLEGIETLMAEGEVYDIEYDPKSEEPERKKGKWIRTRTMTHDGELYCSECEQEHPEQKIIWNFCPNCGADMRGDSDE